MDESEYIRTNISITPKQRDTLKKQEMLTGKSMSQLVREALDLTFPDPPPFDPVVSINGHNLHLLKNRDKVRITDDDFKDLFTGGHAIWEKIAKNKEIK